MRVSAVVVATAWFGDGCFKDPGQGECVGVAACACYDDGGCNGDLVCDIEGICRRADCRAGQELCACVDGECLGGLVCDGQSCRVPGSDDAPGDAPGEGPGDVAEDAPDDGEEQGDAGTTSLDEGSADRGPPSDDGGVATTSPTTDTDASTDAGDVGESSGTGAEACEPPADSEPWHCGWVDPPGYYDCGGSGACGPVGANPLACPDGFGPGSACEGTTVVDPVQGCCLPGGDLAFCLDEGGAIVVPCAPPASTTG